MPNPRRTNGARRDKLSRRIRNEETNCHLCGQPVNNKLQHGLPASPEIDELIPISLGGNPLDRNNTHLSHRWCNRWRSTKPANQAKTALHADPPTFNTNGTLKQAGGRTTTKQLQPTTSRNW